MSGSGILAIFEHSLSEEPEHNPGLFGEDDYLLPSSFGSVTAAKIV